ncbi:AAA family ATPase [Limnobacter sp. P1]|uniref:AAA family ATPase n=1 Tax=Limnobacter olei TaxID=3031298 RepID=UPI0023B10081|nr:AAA family ATPase [Limnobacter sp. P1]
MKPIMFHVVKPRTRIDATTAPDFILAQDDWNDYSFRTLYHLSYFECKDGKREETLIGPVKILKRGQKKGDGISIHNDFDRLGDEFCSVGDSLDYYERLSALGALGEEILRLLRDVVQSPELVQDFKDETGWGKSLFRDQQDAGSNFRYLADGIVQGHYSAEPIDQQPFSFQMPGWLSAVNIDTKSETDDFFRKSILPERVNVLVGRNGSGKSTLLSRLARVAFASTTERVAQPLSNLGTMLPAGVGFPRVITIAFSPFDNFKLPGTDARNMAQIAKDMQRGVGRFVFIGLRDFAAEATVSISELPNSVRGQTSPNADRVNQTRLKTMAELVDDFDSYRSKINNVPSRQLILQRALDKLKVGLMTDEWLNDPNSGSAERASDWFRQCSTGYKIAILIIFGLVAQLEHRSLVLIDEPESHLHPPLLSAMMHALRLVLKEFESSALVATHSPVVVQECLARHVHVVRREGENVAIRPVTAETFGESIGLITAQVFGMESNATDFHEVLERLIKKHKSLEEIEKLFMDGVMSNQARAYVMSRLAEGNAQ